MSANYNLQEIGLAKAFNKRGIKCDVVYCGKKVIKTVPVEFAAGEYFNVFYLSGKNFLKNVIYTGLYDLIGKYDILLAGGYDQIQSWLLAKKYHSKLVIYHGTYYSNFNIRYNIKCRLFDMLFLSRYRKYEIPFVTKSILAANFLRKKGIKNVTAIGVGIDTEQLKSQQSIESELSKEISQQKSNGNNILLYIGEISRRRNTLFLLAILKAMIVKKKNIKLVFIGDGNMEYKEECFHYIKTNGLKDHIIYENNVKHELLPEIYKLSDIFLLPTKYEIFGMVLLEAMYFGTPVITTYNGGSDMLIQNGITGIIRNDFHVDGWCDDILKLLKDKTLRNLMSKSAKQRIIDCFTWDMLVNRFLDVFAQQAAKKANEYQFYY
ncbi:MAG: glycosyltransferase family 4 protein [Planctomycetaceae bacterium]|jgi:glycosyltransferase involved in cell wall biosynthesis|nr:glycosyltransferase family 4 protein [Planctomycetaceae bacterium]